MKYFTEKSLSIKYILAFCAVAIVVASLYYSNQLVKDLEKEERKKIEIWAEATSELVNNESLGDLSFILKVIEGNTTIPVVIFDTTGTVLHYRNLGLDKDADELTILNRANELKQFDRKIEIVVGESDRQFLYYEDSILLRRLFYFPYLQMGVMFTFLLIVVFALLSSKRAEQNKVWVGLSKETAHQLGTPISSMMAWVELLKEGAQSPQLLTELEKDVQRLETIADRFSKIGSKPEPTPENLNLVLGHVVGYLQGRISQKVQINMIYHKDNPNVLLNVPLFEWVIENLCKNAVDAMDGAGSITIQIELMAKRVIIKMLDTGKGLPKSKFKEIFKPGYTTKKRGWGLGLSLAKRIIEDYHAGKIYVDSSELHRGTVFKIELNRHIQ